MHQCQGHPRGEMQIAGIKCTRCVTQAASMLKHESVLMYAVSLTMLKAFWCTSVATNQCRCTAWHLAHMCSFKAANIFASGLLATMFSCSGCFVVMVWLLCLSIAHVEGWSCCGLRDGPPMASMLSSCEHGSFVCSFIQSVSHSFIHSFTPPRI